MNKSQRVLYETPSFFDNPLSHLQQIWTLVLADFNSAGISYQRASLLSAFTIQLLHQARTLSPQNKLQRDEIARFLQWYPHIFLKTQGGYLNHLLGQSIVNELMMTNGNITEYQKLLETRITFMLSEWVESHKQIKKSKEEGVEVDTWGVLNGFLAKTHYDNIYDKLLFIEFIRGDLIALQPDWLTVTEKGLEHLDSVAKFLSLMLPKVLFNIHIQAEYFPKAMTDANPRPAYDILYLNQNKHAELVKRALFYELVTFLLENLLNHFQKLHEKQQPGILHLVFNYFYAYHDKHLAKSSKFLFTILQKLPSVIRYAKFNDIMLFLAVLEKFQYQPFVKDLYEKFTWIQESKQKLENPPANPRNAIDIFLSEEKLIVIPASQVVIQLVEVFHPYSLVYFDINCKAADVDVNLYYAGGFNQTHELKKLVFEKKRLKAKQQFKGSIEAVQPGLYYLELNNSYSWMTAKTVGYKLEVIVPMDIYYPYQSSPYSRFLMSQLSLGIPYQLKIDYDFFERGQNQANLCDIRITKDNYIVTAGTYTYELETGNVQSAYAKLEAKLRIFEQSLNVKNYSINGKRYIGSKIEQIVLGISAAVKGLEENDMPSPVEMLKDVQSNRGSVEEKRLSVVKEQSRGQSEIKGDDAKKESEKVEEREEKIQDVVQAEQVVSDVKESENQEKQDTSEVKKEQNEQEVDIKQLQREEVKDVVEQKQQLTEIEQENL